MSSSKTIYLLLGSNMLNPKKQLAKARALIKNLLASIIKSSSLYRTAAWGITNQDDFYNQVVKIKSSRSPQSILKIIKHIESLMGRIHIDKWGPRIIDIDILFFGRLRMRSKKLTIPHPLMLQRRFVMTPLVELAPKLIHPVTGLAISTMYSLCTDSLPVKKIH